MGVSKQTENDRRNYHYHSPTQELDQSNSANNEETIKIKPTQRTQYGANTCFQRKSTLSKAVIILSFLFGLLLVFGGATIIVSYVICDTPLGLIVGNCHNPDDCLESQVPPDSIVQSPTCTVPYIIPNADLLPTLSECGHPYTSKLVTETRKRRVAGGTEVRKKCAFPWMAKVLVQGCKGDEDEEQFACGGTLITKRYVLTSAHCVVPCVKPISVKLQNIEEPIRIEESIVHPEYKRPCDCTDGRNDTFEEKSAYRPYDVALVRLDQDVNITAHSPICLPYKKLYCMGDSKGFDKENSRYSAGWGFLSNDEFADVSEDINYIRLPTVGNTRCQAYFHNDTNISDSMICAGGIEGEDVCDGDSGGPLFVNVDGRSFQVGVLGFGKKPCAIGAPSVFVSVTSFLPWIAKQLKP